MAGRTEELQEKTREKIKATGLSKRELVAFSNLFRKMYNVFCRACQLHYIYTVSGRDDALAGVDVSEWKKGLCPYCLVEFEVKFEKKLERFCK